MYLCMICGGTGSGKTALLYSLLHSEISQSPRIINTESQIADQNGRPEMLEKTLRFLRETAICKKMEECRRKALEEQCQHYLNARKAFFEVIEATMAELEQEVERIRLEIEECIDARIKDLSRNELLNELSRILCHGYAEHQLGMKLSAYAGKSKERLDNRERIQCAQNPRSVSRMMEIQRRFPRILEILRRFIPPDLFQRYIRLCIRSVSNYGILGTAS